MIYPPEFPPNKGNPAEEQVFNILKMLDPDRYDVFYDRRFVGMQPGEKKEYQADFLVADLSGGRFNALLVMEVKGGIVKYDGINSRWTQNGHAMHESDDPVDQALSNMHSLVQHYADISRRVPFGWAVCFPDRRNIYSRKQIPEFLAPIQLVESSALQSIDKQLPGIFKYIRAQNAHKQGADMKTYGRLKESLLAGLGMVVPLHARLAAHERQLITLTNEQMQLLQMIGNNQLLKPEGRNTRREDSCLAGVKHFGAYPLAGVDDEIGCLSASAVNLARIRTFKGLEADVVFVLDTHKMAKGDYKTAYAQGSRARVWLGVFGGNV
jgi:hypothetical protein